jgi:hypothetical protein
MILNLKRNIKTDNSTIGSLTIEDKFICYTLEDVERDKKIPNETCIPTGTYQIVITDSIRFKRKLPLLLNVPNFEGIRIHAGNTKKDTSGCILPGLTLDKDFVGKSKPAFEILYKIINDTIKSGKEVWIIIE